MECPHCQMSSNYEVEDEKIIKCKHCEKEFLCWYDFTDKKFVGLKGFALWYTQNPNRNIYMSGE